jgi:AcrR family transcriptional regulator
MARRTKADAERTRSLLLDTAERVFHAQGVSRTTLDDIAKAANLTRGAIYWHFANKEELFNAMHQRLDLPLENIHKEIIDSDNPLDALENFWIDCFKNIAADENAQRLLNIMFLKCEYVDEFQKLSCRRKKTTVDLIQFMTEIFAAAQKKGLLVEGADPRLAAVAMEAAISGLLSGWLFQPSVMDINQVGAPLIHYFLRGYRT